MPRLGIFYITKLLQHVFLREIEIYPWSGHAVLEGIKTGHSEEDGNHRQTAQTLGISLCTLQYRLKEFRLVTKEKV